VKPPAWFSRLTAPLQRNRWESNLQEDIQEHLDLAIEENIRQGMTPVDAAAAARRSFGGAEQMKEEFRDQRGIPALETFMREIRIAFRSLRRAPTFALLSIATLALAIGANSAIFSAVNALLFRPPGIAEPSRLAVIRSQYTKLNLNSLVISYDDYQQVDSAKIFSSIALAKSTDMTYTGGAVPQRLAGLRVTWRWFDVLGAYAQQGRVFNQGDEGLPNKQLVLLTHAAWQRVFGGDPAAVGKTILLDQRPYKIVGILKPDYVGAVGEMGGVGEQPKDLVFPMTIRDDPRARYNESYLAITRLAPGMSFEKTASALHVLTARLHQASQRGGILKENGWGLFAVPYNDFAGGEMKTPLLILWGSVGLVLLIAAANIAGLTLARMSARTRELAVRTALGGTRWHLLRQLFAECALLSFAGSVAGLGVAYLFIRTVEHYAPDNVVGGLRIPYDWQMLAFAALAGIVAAVLSTLIPATQLLRAHSSLLLKEGGRSATASRERLRLRSILVSAEVALALILSIGAGLLLRSLSRLENVNPGLRPQGVMTASLALPEARYKDAEHIVDFYRQLIRRAKILPGATSAAISYPLPFGPGFEGRGFRIAGRPIVANQPSPQANIRLVTPEFFTSLGIPLLQGRAFTEQDTVNSQLVTIIDQTLADRYWPNQDPIGQKMIQGEGEHTSVIVGVVGHTTQADTNQSSDRGYFYIPLYQDTLGFGSLLVKAPGDAATLAKSLQATVNAIDPAQALYDVKTMQQRIDSTFAARRFTVVLLGCFAAMSIFLAALGLYGVMNYGVTQRTQEIGIRMALGAHRSQVLNMILGQGFKIAAQGILIGGFASYWIARSLQDQLFGVQAFDVSTFAAAATALTAIALLATFIPARRATLLNPVEACRCE
jgi:predicted permease